MRARLSKRHKKEVIQFEMNLSENLWKLHYDLKYGRYRVGGYHKFMIYDPKEREIQAITYRDRIVQHSICDNFLTPLLEKRLIYDNAACRKGKGSSFAIKRLKSFMRRHYKEYGTEGCFVKADVHKYFNSIDHEILKQRLKKIVYDEKILSLLFSIIDSYFFTEGRGLPMGNQTSQCFALLYLDGLDRAIKEKLRVKFYVRYMDDMIFLLPDKNAGRGVLALVEKELLRVRLSINPTSRIIAIKSGIEFLGWRFCFSPSGGIVQRLRRSTKRRILDKVRAKKVLSAIKKEETIISYRGFLMRSKSYFFFYRIFSAIC